VARGEVDGGFVYRTEDTCDSLMRDCLIDLNS